MDTMLAKAVKGSALAILGLACALAAMPAEPQSRGGGARASGGGARGWHGGGHHHHHRGGWHGSRVVVGVGGWGWPGYWYGGGGPYYPYGYAYPYPYAYPYSYEPAVSGYSGSAVEWVELGATRAAPPPAGGSFYYYCASAKGYYPYVSHCAEAWQQVPTTPPS